MSERWVNAVIEICVPLDISPDAHRFAKQQVLGDLMGKLVDVLPEDFAEHVGTGRWEDVDEVALESAEEVVQCASGCNWIETPTEWRYEHVEDCPRRGNPPKAISKPDGEAGNQ